MDYDASFRVFLIKCLQIKYENNWKTKSTISEPVSSRRLLRYFTVTYINHNATASNHILHDLKHLILLRIEAQLILLQ